MNKNNLLSSIQLGLLGGFIATILMDIVMFIEFFLMKQKITTNYAVIGSAVGGGVWLGLILHFIIGPTLGLIFGVIVSSFKSLHIDTLKKGVILGTLAGIITIPLGCVPTAILSKVPILDLVSFSAIPHLVWGSALGYIVGSGKSKQ